MRQTHLILSLLISLTAIPAALSAQSPTQLPVTRVSLYKNGVGFFEHAGRVSGDQSVTINFTTAQLNDVLQSLTAIDLNGGRIAGADYNSTTPLEQQLNALPLALGEYATTADFYNAIRGARVAVNGPGAKFSGRLLDIEEANTPATVSQPASRKRLITVIGDTGEVRTVELTPATSVTLLDAGLHQDVTRYLELLAGTRNQGLRHLTIEDNGAGTRELRVSYISEVPIWKSTYRILFTEPKTTDASSKQTATLQGWSVVDNTTGADWIDVQLSLIAGAPQSFIQPLSVPYYSRRPLIGLPQEAQLTPQTHESGEFETAKAKATGIGGANQTVTVTDAPPYMNANGAGLGGTIENQLYSQLPLTMNGGARSPMALQYMTPGVSGIYGGSGGTNLNQNYLEGMPISAEALAMAATNSFAGDARTAKFDDYFEYKIGEPVTIRKNESALVPILQTSINAERVTLWSRQQPVPLRALWITNTSNLTLDRGSFSIVEDGNFGGEGLMEPIHPDERRLLSYAVDQAVRVTLDPQSNTSRTTSVTAAKGVITLHTTQIAETTYVVRNAADEARTVVVEHPIRSGYTLASDATPAETTPTVYRFRVEVKPNETARLHVKETMPGETRYELSTSNDDQLTFLLNQTGHNPTFEAALQPILEARRHVAEMQEAVDKGTSQLDGLRSDEQRQRDNVSALANADKASRERFVHDLNATEDQITATQKELTAAQANLQAAQDDLANRIESLQIDETI